MSQARPITIEDVARAAGVSRQTVSRAINDKGEISPQTRQRILDIAESLGYHPSSIARSLATRTSSTIGLIVPDIANPFFPEIARGVEEAAFAAGYQVFLSNTAEDATREWDILRSLEQQRVAGVILCSSRLPDEQLQTATRRPFPLVCLNRQIVGADSAALLIDDFHGARQATRYLLERGHRAIGMLTGPARSWSGARRLEGYRAALDDAGIPYEPRRMAAGFPQVEGGRIAAAHLLSIAPDTGAILAYNDLMAVGAMRACAQLGRRVPADCAVMGFDDIPLASFVAPALTTMQVDKPEAGRRVFNLLRRMMEERLNGPAIEILVPQLVVRDST
jgi:LacI family transcriptional regulator